MSSTAAPSSPNAGVPRPRITEAQWASAKADFELGTKTASQIAHELGIKRQTVADNLKARGAVYGSKSKIVEAASIDAAKSDSAKRAEEVQTMREKQRKLIETTQQLAAKALMDSIRDNTPISQKKNDVLTLKNIMAIFAAGRAELWEIYGLNDDKDAGEELPEFAVSEYTPDELELMNKAREGDTYSPDEALAELERQASEEGEGDDPLKGLLDDAED